MGKNLGKTVLGNLFWRFGERILAQMVTFVVSIVLARILEPSDYGVIALITVFITIANVFIDSGIVSSLIQKKNADELDFCSMFYFNVGFTIVMYWVIFFAAPYIAAFYDKPIITPVLRVLALQVPLSGIKSVQNAVVSRKMIFKKFFFSTLGGTLGSAAVGIVMALKGFGVWALVGQYLFNSVVDTTILWLTVKWRPRRRFSWKRIDSLVPFGWKMLVVNLLNTTYNEVRNLIIGKLYSSEDLAYYNKGQNFPKLFINNIVVSMTSVLFPALSTLQDNKERLKDVTRQSVRVTSYVLFPMMAGLAAIATPLIRLLLTEKWMFCVPYLQICCFTYATWAYQVAPQEAIKALGRSDVYLRMEIIRKVFGMGILIAVMRISVMAIALSNIAATIVSVLIIMVSCKSVYQYGYREQIADIIPSLLLTIVMFAAVQAVGMIHLNDMTKMIIQVVVGGGVYLILSIISKNKEFQMLNDYMMKFIKKDK